MRVECPYNRKLGQVESKQNNVMKSHLPLLLKRKVYNQYLLLVQTNGSEIWSIIKSSNEKWTKGDRENNVWCNIER